MTNIYDFFYMKLEFYGQPCLVYSFEFRVFYFPLSREVRKSRAIQY